jgi:PST family polysaccharide transporter
MLAGAPLVWFGVPALAEMFLAAMLCWRMTGQHLAAGWWRGWSERRARALVGAGLPLLFSGAAVSVYMKIDQVMLREMAGEGEAGVYAAAVRLSEGVYFLPVATVMALLPIWSRAREADAARGERVTQGVYDLLTALALGFALTVSFFSGELVRLLFGAEFAAAGPVLAVHAWAAVFVFQGVVRSQEWIFENLNCWTLLTTVAGALANVILNWWWIPPLGARGAALATLCSYGLTVWLLAFLAPATRPSAWRQTKALLLPVLGWRYLRLSKADRDTSNF